MHIRRWVAQPERNAIEATDFLNARFDLGNQRVVAVNGSFNFSDDIHSWTGTVDRVVFGDLNGDGG